MASGELNPSPCGCRNQGEEEKRQVFKYMKSHRIGERVASRFLEQAHLELAYGE